MSTRLKHYRSASTSTFDVVRRCLADDHAKRMLFDYGEDGRVRALAFALALGERPYSFRLPARVHNVERIRYGERALTEAQRDQVYRTAWANIRDWLLAQMALIATEMVKAKEVFLPYLLNPQGQTYVETPKHPQFRVPTGGSDIREGEVVA